MAMNGASANDRIHTGNWTLSLCLFGVQESEGLAMEDLITSLRLTMFPLWPLLG